MSGADADDGDERGVSVREQDRFLPIANISRIMKKALPPNAKIAKDAKETVQECVSEFISFITSECDPAPLAGFCTVAVLPRACAGRPRCVLASTAQRGGCGKNHRAHALHALTPPNEHTNLVLRCLQTHMFALCDRASDKCQREKRKTINGDDLLWAMSTLGFEEYVEPLKVYLAKFREVRLPWGMTAMAG